MSIFYVKKDGSGTHTQIQGAIFDSVDGDIINVGVGTWYENIELYKSVQLIGSGKDQTFIEGQLANQTVVGCSYYQGEDVITVPSTASLVKGRRVGSTVGSFAANSRVSEIISGTQFRVFPTTVASTVTKTAVSVVSGSSTITLPNVTGVLVGMKVVGAGVDGIITLINTSTKVITLNTPNSVGGSSVLLTFKTARNNATITMYSQFSGSTFPATIQFMNVATNGAVVKDLTAIGFDGNTNTEAAAISLTSPATGSHQNWLIDGCKLIANGDQAIASSSNLKSTNGTIQNCVFDGKTFVGSEPAEVASFGAFQYSVANVARQMVVIGNSSSVSNCVNTTFKNNVVNGVSGAVISATGNRSMFNTAVTIDTVGGLIEDNVIDGNFGAGGTNTVISNFAIRSRRPEGVAYETIIRNNTNIITGGRGNSGFYFPGSPVVVSNNTEINSALINLVQPLAGQSFDATMDKEALKGISKVSSSVIFSDEANWDMVTYVFKQVGGSKRLTCTFKDPTASIKMKLRLGVLSGMQFELHKVIIAKSDRSLLVVKRSEIDGASAMDIVLA